MKTYIFEGKQSVFLPGFGEVKPGQTVTSALPINHPDFIEQEGDATASKK